MRRNHPTPRQSSERGQVLFIVAAGMAVFLLIAGLVIDGGLGYRERRLSQNVSDLAAVAGTRIVADFWLDGGTATGSDVFDAINASVLANDCDGAEGCSWTAMYVRPNPDGSTTEVDVAPVLDAGTIPLSAQGVRVTTSSDVDTFFMRIVGIDQIDVATTATALTSQLPEGSPPGVLLPIGVFDSQYETGSSYTLTEGEHGPGNFGWLTWFGSPDANALAGSVCMPDNPEYTFPVWIEGATGVMNKSEVRDCFDAYIANQTTVLVPIWSQTNNGGGSHLDYEVIGLAAFILEDYDRHAVSVTGRFQRFYSLPSIPAGYGAPPCANCGEITQFIGLVR
jgi:hypothetical protein